MMLSKDGVLKVMDFGLVRLQDEQQGLTMTGMIMGTASYLSPEQGQGAHCDIRTDIYALGVVFYQLLTKRVPFTGNNLTAVIYHHINSPPRLLREIDPKIPEDYQAVVLKCLEKDPEHRYATPQDLYADLRALAHGKSLSLTSDELRRLRKGRTLGAEGSKTKKSSFGKVALICCAVLVIGGAGAAAVFWPQLKQWAPIANLLKEELQEGIESTPSVPSNPAQENAANNQSVDPTTPVAPTKPITLNDRAEADRLAAEAKAKKERLVREQEAAELASLLEQVESVAQQAIEDDVAYTQLQLLAKQHADTKEIGPILDRVTSQRQLLLSAKLNSTLEQAQRHLTMGEIDLAEAEFTKALTLDAQNVLAEEGLKSVALWRQRRAKSAVLMERFQQAMTNEDLAQGKIILSELQQHDPTYPPIADAIAQEAQLSATLEARQKAAAEKAAAEAKALAAAELAKRISEAERSARERTEIAEWNTKRAQSAEEAVVRLEGLDTDNTHIPKLRLRIKQQNADLTATVFLQELDKKLASKNLEEIAMLIDDQRILNALAELIEDEAFTFHHRLVSTTLDKAGNLSQAQVEVTHALSVMPETKLSFEYLFTLNNDSWRIQKVTALNQ